MPSGSVPTRPPGRHVGRAGRGERRGVPAPGRRHHRRAGGAAPGERGGAAVLCRRHGDLPGSDGHRHRPRHRRRVHGDRDQGRRARSCRCPSTSAVSGSRSASCPEIRRRRPRWLRPCGPSAAELDRAVAAIPALAETAQGPRRLVGLAGTVSTLASLELGLAEYDRERIHHAVLTLEAVARWCDVLGAEPVAARARRRGLPAGRQDVIFGGALVLREVMRRFDLPRVHRLGGRHPGRSHHVPATAGGRPTGLTEPR